MEVYCALSMRTVVLLAIAAVCFAVSAIISAQAMRRHRRRMEEMQKRHDETRDRMFGRGAH